MADNIFYPKGRTNPFIKDLDEYKELYQQSLNYPEEFFGNLARENIKWIEDFDSVHNGSRFLTLSTLDQPYSMVSKQFAVVGTLSFGRQNRRSV